MCLLQSSQYFNSYSNLIQCAFRIRGHPIARLPTAGSFVIVTLLDAEILLGSEAFCRCPINTSNSLQAIRVLQRANAKNDRRAVLAICWPVLHIQMIGVVCTMYTNSDLDKASNAKLSSRKDALYLLKNIMVSSNLPLFLPAVQRVRQR